MLGLDFQIDRSTHPRNLLGILAEQRLLSPLIASYLLHVHKLRVAPTLNGASVIRIQAPLVINREEADFLLRAIEETLPVLAAGDTSALIAHLLDEQPKQGPFRPASPKDLPGPLTDQICLLVHPWTSRAWRITTAVSPASVGDLAALARQWLPK